MAKKPPPAALDAYGQIKPDWNPFLGDWRARQDAIKPGQPGYFTPLPDRFEQAFDPVTSMADLHIYDGKLIVGLNDVTYARHLAATYDPGTVKSFQDWATQHPTADPRTYFPLALAHIDPSTPESHAVVTGDLLGRIRDHTYLAAKGSPTNTISTPDLTANQNMTPLPPPQGSSLAGTKYDRPHDETEYLDPYADPVSHDGVAARNRDIDRYNAAVNAPVAAQPGLTPEGRDVVARTPFGTSAASPYVGVDENPDPIGYRPEMPGSPVYKQPYVAPPVSDAVKIWRGLPSGGQRLPEVRHAPLPMNRAPELDPSTNHPTRAVPGVPGGRGGGAAAISGGGPGQTGHTEVPGAVARGLGAAAKAVGGWAAAKVAWAPRSVEAVKETLPDQIQDPWNHTYNMVKGTSRVTLGTAESGPQAVQATARTLGGDVVHQNQVADKYHLNRKERLTVFSDLEAGKNFTDTTGWEWAAENAGVRPITSYTQEEQDRLRAARNEFFDMGWRKYAGNRGQAVLKQTTLGVMIDSPGLIVHTTDKDGNTVQQRGWIMNDDVRKIAGARAVQTWDITSAEDRMKGLPSHGFSFGRYTADLVSSPGETGYNIISGGVDGVVNMAFDPTNLVPGAVAAKMVRAPVSLARATARLHGAVSDSSRVGRAFNDFITPTFREAAKNKGEDLVVHLPTQRFVRALRGPGGEIMRDEQGAAVYALDKAGNPRPMRGYSPYHGLREGARNPKAVAAARAADAEEYISPDIKLDEAGRLVGPHGVGIVKSMAWEFLGRGKGARMVAALAAEHNIYTIMQMTGGRMPAHIAKQFADAPTTDAVKAIFATHIGYELRDPSQLGSLGRSGPALFKNRFMMDSAGILSQRGRNAYRDNYQQGLDIARDTKAFKARAKAAGIGEDFDPNSITVNMADKSAAFVRSASATGVGLFRLAPSAIALNLEDADVTFKQMDAFFRGARFSSAEIAPMMDELMRAPHGARRYELIYGMEGEKDTGFLNVVVKKALREQGLSEDKATFMTRAFEGGLGHFNGDWLNDSLPDGFGTHEGNVGRPMVESEMLKKAAALPDYKRLRKATGGMQRILQTPEMSVADKMNTLSEWANGLTSAWRYSVLIRPAYILREVGELAFAMALGGYKGLYTNPMAFLSAAHTVALAKEVAEIANPAARWLSGAPMRKAWIKGYAHFTNGVASLAPSFGNEAARINGKGFWDDVNDVMRGRHNDPISAMYDAISATHGNFQLDEAGARAMAKWARVLNKNVRGDEDAYIDALVLKMMRAHSDRDMRNLANPDMDRKMVMDAFEGGTYSMKKSMRPDLLTDDPASMGKYLDGYESILHTVTAGSQADLLEAIRTGKYAGKDLMDIGQGHKPFVPPELRARLKEILADDELRKALPPVLHDFNHFRAGKRWGREFANDFFTSVGEWSDIFARGPLIRQAYAKRVIELAPHLSPEARADAISKLASKGDFKLAKQVAATKKNPTGVLGIEDVDFIASGYARHEAERVFYDAHKRQNYALALRVVMPFAQATFNTFRRWGEMMVANPQLAYRATKPLQALMQPGSAAIYGIASSLIPGEDGLNYFYNPKHPEYGVDGFFFHNEYGDRMWAIPGLGSLASLFPGVKGTPVAIGSVSGLNVAGTSLFPGVGPVLTFAESLFLPDHVYQPDRAGQILRAISPFGVPTGSFGDRLFGAFMATWQRRASQLWDPQEQAGITTRAIPGVYSSGHYDLTTQQGVNHLLNDSKRTGESLTGLDIFGVTLTPASFTTQLMVEIQGDKTGALRSMMLAGQLRDIYRKYIKPLPGQDPWEAKNQGEGRFVVDYGGTALLAVWPRTEVDGPQATNEIWHWRGNNPQAYSDNVEVIGNFFKGGDPNGEFAQNPYEWQKATGERHNTAAKDFLAQVNNQHAYLYWNKALDEIDTYPEEDRAIAKERVRQELIKDFPGFDGRAKDMGKFDRQMATMRSALDNPAVASLDSAPYIKTYLDSRDDAIETLRSMGVTASTPGAFRTKVALNSGITAQMEAIARDLRQKDTSGGFTNFWSRLAFKDFEKGALD